MVKAEFLELFKYRDLLINLVIRDITVRYKRSVLGFFWTMLNPLINTAIFTIVFSTIFRFGVKDFVIYFLSGYQLWNFFSTSTVLSSRCILMNGPLLKKVYIPKTIFVLSVVLSELANFALAMVPLLILLPFLGKGLTAALFFLPVPLLLAVAFTLGVSLVLAGATVFFHDIMDIYQLLVMPWMFLTPIIYPIEIVPPKFLPFIKLNPMYYIVECFRAPIYGGHLPDPHVLLWAALVSGVSLAVGVSVFNRWADEFIYYI